MLFDRSENGFKKPFDRCLTDMKNLEIRKAAKSYEKSSFSYEKLLFRWQPKKDSNPHKQSQSYHNMQAVPYFRVFWRDVDSI